ncbi:MAG TPA: altronate dehydratase family protein [Candidatus Acidoferrum sp.]|nr:altronate dehydratase family protein [Candidatus Acidoferrum sp.]
MTTTARIPAIRIAPGDDVAVALRDLAAGETIELPGVTLQLREAIPRGHKFALHAINVGDAVHKYGWTIGKATVPIAAGAHVHTHNLVTQLQASDDYRYQPLVQARPTAAADHTFMGYRRDHGRVGTRNEIWILCTVGCVARTAERIARQAAQQYAGRVDGVYAYTHQFGCSQLGGDLDRTRKLLAALALHPNAGGVLVIGLGCESNQLDKLLAEIPAAQRSRIRAFAAQQSGDETEAGLRLIAELVDVAAQDHRTSCPLADLTIGVKCGGSDGLSGLSANPLVGSIADAVSTAGGAAILTEIPEIFGAERLLMQRATDEKVFEGLVRVVNEFKQYFVRNNQPVHENPSPGNIAGGITTLEEKSLGAVQKGGHAVVTDVIDYAGRCTRRGLTVLEAPGNDGISSTALVAAGATIVLFTTGRGTPLGFPAPTLKISSNSELAHNKPHWIDFDAGRVLSGEPMERLSEELLALILAVASGQPARNEQNGEREIAIWKDGVTL